jgi:hypothetical protein
MPGQKRVFALDVSGIDVFFYATQNVDSRGTSPAMTLR